MENLVAHKTLSRAAIFRCLVAIASLLLLGATWNLWIHQANFPQIPLVSFVVESPGWFDYAALFCVFLSTILLLGVWRKGRNASQRAVFLGKILFLAGFSGLFLLDQHRLQVWAWQFVLAMLILLIIPERKKIAWLQRLAISVYFFSAVSKMDLQFVDGIGQQLLGGLFQSIGLSADRLSSSMKQAFVISFPIGELLVALLLFIPRTRKVGFVLSLLMHALLLLTLGPWGLNHSLGVIGWNIFFIVQNCILFTGTKKEEPLSDAESMQITWKERLQCWAIGLILLAPALQWFGHWDHWLGWAVYSERNDVVRVYIDKSRVNDLPDSLRPYVGSPSFENDFCRVAIDDWSLKKLGVPQYPQLRVELAVAYAIAKKYQLGEKFLVEVIPPQSRWTRKRNGNETIRRYHQDSLAIALDQFFGNTTSRNQD